MNTPMGKVPPTPRTNALLAQFNDEWQANIKTQPHADWMLRLIEHTKQLECELVAARERGDILAAQACGHIKMRDEARAKAEALAARVSVLFEAMDDADGALDKDTYDELRREDWEIPDDADISIQNGTRKKISKVFLAIDQIRNSLKSA